MINLSKSFWVGAVTLGLIAAGCGSAQQPPAAQPQAPSTAPQSTDATTSTQQGSAIKVTKAEDTRTIVMSGSVYTPPVAVAKTGDTVTWVNKDTVPHTVTSFPSDKQAFNLTISPGKSATVTFNQPGIERYYSTKDATYSTKMKDVEAKQSAKAYPIPMEGAIVVLNAKGSLADTRAQVTIPDSTMDFEPWAVVIPAGATLTFTNNDGDAHAVASVPGYAASTINTFVLKGNGGTGSINLTQPGVYYYYCPLHATWEPSVQQLKPLKVYGSYPFEMAGLIVVTPNS